MRREPQQTASSGRRWLGRLALLASIVGAFGVLLFLGGAMAESPGQAWLGLLLTVSGALTGFALSLGVLWRKEPTPAPTLALVVSVILVGLIGWGAYEFTRPDTSVLTSETGCDWDPTAAKLPQGALVFSSECSGTYRVWLLDGSGGTPRKLTQGNLLSEDAFPAASPEPRPA